MLKMTPAVSAAVMGEFPIVFVWLCASYHQLWFFFFLTAAELNLLNKAAWWRNPPESGSESPSPLCPTPLLALAANQCWTGSGDTDADHICWGEITPSQRPQMSTQDRVQQIRCLHSLLFVTKLRLLVDQVLFEVRKHLHRHVHLPRQLRGFVLQVLLLLAQPLALLLGPLQLGALPLQLRLQTTHTRCYFLLHLCDERQNQLSWTSPGKEPQWRFCLPPQKASPAFRPDLAVRTLEPSAGPGLPRTPPPPRWPRHWPPLPRLCWGHHGSPGLRMSLLSS